MSLTLVQTTPRRRRQTPLRQAALNAARAALIHELSEVGIRVLNPTIITEAVCRAFVKADVDAKRTSRPFSPQTVALSRMAVGDTITLTGSSRTTAHQRLRYAREIMGNPDAVWTMRTVPGGVEVTRLDDGAEVVGIVHAPAAKALAAMQVGESRIMNEHGMLPRDGYYKTAARRVLKDENANWTMRVTTKGLRITRIA